LIVAVLACDRGQNPGRCSDPEAEATGIAWDRLSGRIAYSRWETGYPPPESHGCIYMIDVPARRVQVLRDAKTVPDDALAPVGWAMDVTFRADRSSLTFAVQDLHGRWQLHDLSLATGKEAMLFVDPDAHHFAPAWSPDGRLAYISNGPLSNDIYIDSQPVQSYANHSRVAWISASALVASISDNTSTGTLYFVDLDKQWMTAIVSGWAGSPAVDGIHQRLAYVHPDANGESIWLANLDGTGATRITSGFPDYDPAWSADGQSILFARSGQGLFLYDVGTGTLSQVTRRPVDSMAWSP
jgi:Tol biopolymer transport system component